MDLASKRKSIFAWLFALLIIAGVFGENRAWAFFDPAGTASGQIEAATPEAIGGNYDASAYDAPGYAVAPKTGLGNPFKDKTPQQIDEMFKKKGFEPRGPDPVNGKGGYVNPKNGRSYHIDEANSFGEPPHVDVNRLRDYKGPLPKKKLPMQPSSGGS